MQNTLSTLEQITCYAIIIALALAVIKQFQYPLSHLTRSLNPWRTRNIIDSISNRLEECEMEKYNQNQINIRQNQINIRFKRQLRKIKKSTQLQRKKERKKHDRTNK